MSTADGGDGALRGRVAVVTGGGRGIGRAIVRALTRAGADVALCARTTAEIEAVATAVRALGRRAVVATADVADRAQVQAFAAVVRGELGKVDLLINNAGAASSAIPPSPRAIRTAGGGPSRSTSRAPTW